MIQAIATIEAWLPLVFVFRSPAMMLEHARDQGPVIYVSRELPRDEVAARMIGMQCDAS